jgi:ubiquinone biosynthesis O-methyltransferase
LSAKWWQSERGPFAGLHQLNEVRVPLVRDALLRGPQPRLLSLQEQDELPGGRPVFRLPPIRPAAASVASAALPLSGLRILDIGCGGGILSEALARIGASVTGVDACKENILAARHHASLDPDFRSDPQRLQYRCATVEALAAAATTPDALFDCVVASEVVEHVHDLPLFLNACCALLKVRAMCRIATPTPPLALSSNRLADSKETNPTDVDRHILSFLLIPPPCARSFSPRTCSPAASWW